MYIYIHIYKYIYIYIYIYVYIHIASNVTYFMLGYIACMFFLLLLSNKFHNCRDFIYSKCFIYHIFYSILRCIILNCTILYYAKLLS